MYNELHFSLLLIFFAAVVQLVSESKTPPVRPNVPDDDCDMRYLKLMQSCWDENPLQRPTFEAVKAKLRQIHGGRFVLLKCNFWLNVGRKIKFALSFFARTVHCLLKSCKTDCLSVGCLVFSKCASPFPSLPLVSILDPWAGDHFRIFSNY